MEGKVGFHNKMHTWQSGLNSKGKLGSKDPAVQPPIQCPQCSSKRSWKDGLRYPRGDHKPIQRYLCRACGYRFSQPNIKVHVSGKLNKTLNPRPNLLKRTILDSDHSIKEILDNSTLPFSEDVASHKITVIGKQLNSFPSYNSKRQVCVSKREAKNLVKVETRQKQAAGATKQAEVKGKILEYAWHRKKQGRLQTTIHTDVRSLTSLLQAGADLFNPESVKEILALNEKWKPNTKALFTSVYSCFLNFLGLTWQKPDYKPQRKQLPYFNF